MSTDTHPSYECSADGCWCHDEYILDRFLHERAIAEVAAEKEC